VSRDGTALPQPSDRLRRLSGWGYDDVRVAAPHAMSDWLLRRLGAAASSPVQAPRLGGMPAPRALPPLPVQPRTDPLARLAAARGQGLPDLLWLRAGRAPALPDAVLRPAEAEVAKVLAACAAAGVRVVPRGGGTSVTGGVNVPAGDQPVVVLDLRGLDGLLALDPASGLATFGAGTLGPAVEASLGEQGLTLGHLPQSWELSSLGGWVVTRSAGQESLGYGRIEDLVAGLELEAPAGRLSLAAMPASAAGPDLRRLVLGSEGRLGVVTRVTVRVRPRPAAREVRAWLLPEWTAGLAAVRELTRSGVALSMLRLSDASESEAALAIGLGQGAMGALGRRYLAARGVGGGCMLLAGAAGDAAQCRRALAAARAELARHRAVALGRAPGTRWLADRFRHPYLRDSLLDAGYATETLETAAPWSRIDAAHRDVGAALATALAAEGERVAVLCHLSHPYPDGASLYFTCFYRTPAEPEPAVARWARLKRLANETLVSHGLTLSHHHGVGAWHAPWLAREIGESGVRVLRAAAAELDPAGVLNPHVLLDPTDRMLE
jgi:alkyldihydroxyacetonephosphate synthase